MLPAVPIAAPQAWLFELMALAFCGLVLRTIVTHRRELDRQRDRSSRAGIALQSIGIALTGIGPVRAILPAESWGALVAYAAILVLMSGAIGLSVWSSLTLGKNWSLEARTLRNHELVRAGPYAYVRHPIYVAMLLFLLSMAVGFGHCLQLVAALPLFFAGTRMRTQAEERLLEQSFGDSFRDYRRSTPAILPRLT
jgi:protein-S-isoprenylcysteine O-methyltransferase Ste14